MKFNFDLFISYPFKEIENNPAKGKWISDFIHHVEITINKLYNRKISIHTSNIKDKDQKVRVLSRTAAFFIIEFFPIEDGGDFTRELDYIEELLENRGPRANQHVLKIENPSKQSRADLKVMSKAKSYKYDLEKLVPSDFTNKSDVRLGSPDTVFWLKLVEICSEIKNRIKIAQGEDSGISFSPNEKKIIYLAETSRDQTYRRDLLQIFLKDYGFKIVPNEPLPEEARSVEKVLREYSDKIFLSIHVIGNEYGSYLKDSTYSIIDFQVRLMAEFQKNILNTSPEPGINLERIIWIPPDVKPIDERHILYINQLKRNREIIDGAEMMNVPIESLKSIIEEKIKNQQYTPETSCHIHPKKGKSIYLMYEIQDQERTHLVVDFFSQKGYVVNSLYHDNIDNYLSKFNTHKKNLLDSEGIVILYDGENKNWLVNCLKEIIKSPGYGKKEGFDFKVLISGHDLNGINKRLLEDIKVIDRVESIDDLLVS